jgi:iron complex transport system ATP-binding protein
MSGPILEIRGLQVAIAGKTVCRGLDLAVRGGESWAILGRNGVGKTTLLLTLAGLRAAGGGDIRVQARPLDAWRGRELARVRGLMPQDTVDAFPYTALEAVLAGRYPHQSTVMGGWGLDAAADVDLARQSLRRVGMAGFDERDCATLSGGERRRVALAALLVQQPALYLLDEPTHHLDPHHQIALLDQLAAECRGGKAALMTLHDPNLAARYCSHALLLFGEGETQAGARAELLTPATLSRLYRHPMGMIEAGARRCFLPD